MEYSACRERGTKKKSESPTGIEPRFLSGTQIFSLSHARDMLNIPSFLISSPSLKFTIFLYLSTKLKLSGNCLQCRRPVICSRLVSFSSFKNSLSVFSSVPDLNRIVKTTSVLCSQDSVHRSSGLCVREG